MKRRTFSRRRGVETRAHAAKAFKRVTRQWQLSQNIACQIVKAVKGPDCPNSGKIVVFSLQELLGSSAWTANANFPDAVRIRRIEGNIYFRPQPITAATLGIDACFAATSQNDKTNYLRVGLRKAQGTQSTSGVPPGANPMRGGSSPSELADYTDARWLKSWEHVFDPGGVVGATASNNFSCCSVQAGYTLPSWETTLGTGAWAGAAVPPIVCEPCGDPEDPATDLGCTFSFQTPRWWHCRVRYGRTIVLKENDDLGLYFGWERMEQVDSVARETQTDMEFFGGIKLLLES